MINHDSVRPTSSRHRKTHSLPFTGFIPQDNLTYYHCSCLFKKGSKRPMALIVQYYGLCNIGNVLQSSAIMDWVVIDDLCTIFAGVPCQSCDTLRDSVRVKVCRINTWTLTSLWRQMEKKAKAHFGRHMLA